MWFASVLLGGCMMAGCLVYAGESGPATVRVSQDSDGRSNLMVDSESFEVKGVGGTEQLLAAVKAGANSFRTWGVRDLEKTIDGKPILDYAYENNLYATVGLWVEHERDGFDYQNEEQVQRQRDRIREEVRRYKDHPAVLLWGLGNEMEGVDYTSEKAYIWQELNELASIVKEEDPNHPVMSVIIFTGTDKIKDILSAYDALDILGLNAYGGAVAIPNSLNVAGWKRPFIVSEFGPIGSWEVEKTEWGAPFEPTSTQKATMYSNAYHKIKGDAGDLLLGSYAFLWGHKQETTPTWFGMFLKSGEKLGAVDAMQEAWTSRLPANRCPSISAIDWSDFAGTVSGGARQEASVRAIDPEKHLLNIEWVIMEETEEYQYAGAGEKYPRVVPGLIRSSEETSVVFNAPVAPGAYRLYVYVRDGNGGAATANCPFFVRD